MSIQRMLSKKMPQALISNLGIQPRRNRQVSYQYLTMLHLLCDHHVYVNNAFTMRSHGKCKNEFYGLHSPQCVIAAMSDAENEKDCPGFMSPRMIFSAIIFSM